MGKRMGRYTVVMERKPAILGYAAICGKKESEGPLGAAFDLTYEGRKKLGKSGKPAAKGSGKLCNEESGGDGWCCGLHFRGRSAQSMHLFHLWT